MEKGEGKGFVWVEETTNGNTPLSLKHKRRAKAAPKVEFVGWGSRSLINFLNSIGKDTAKPLSQIELTAIITDYVNTFKLQHPDKKKRVLCDERLYLLFGKNSIPRNKIHELLDSHLAENRESSEDDYFSCEEYADVNITCKKPKVSSLEKQTPAQKKKTSELPLSKFASVIPENLKLLYLKRSLVQDLVKHPESFEEKLLGSYVRVKTDPNDYSQKNSFQLLPVTGVKNIPGKGDIREGVVLQVPFMIKDIPICKLSDDDFSKEECEELCQKVKDGLLKRPTVVEVEQKAQLLHEDITKHWIPREVKHLQNLIERANEKGWRRELFEYLERKKLLETPSEQTKLLTEIPKVTADILEPEATAQEQVQDINLPNGKDVSHPTVNGGTDQALPSSGRDDAAEDVVIVGVNGGVTEPVAHVGSGVQLPTFEWVETETKSLGQASNLNNGTVVIDLSDDEETTPELEEEHENKSPNWFYKDPQGNIQGPVSKNSLKSWSDAGYFLPDFKVWKDGQTPQGAILLTEMLLGTGSK